MGATTLIVWTRLPSAPYLLFYPAVLISAWVGGLGAGLFAIVLTLLVLAYFFLPPDASFAVADPRDQVDLFIFSLLSAVLVVALVRLRRALAAKEIAYRSAEEARALAEQERALLRSVIDHLTAGVAFASADGRSQLDNPALRRMLGGLGRPADLHDLAQHHGFRWAEGRPVSAGEWEETLCEATERPVSFDVEIRRPDGSFVPTSQWLVPVRATPDGPLIGTVSVVRDVSAERAIAELREELVAVIAHDLRSPIAAIQLSLENALRTPVDHGAVRVPVASIERMCRSTQRLGAMVSELLDASRIELKNLSLDRGAADLAQVVAELVDEARSTLGDRRLAIELPRQPLVASIDRLRLAQVVTNLLDNAAKFSRPGSAIRVTLREDAGGAHLAVSDEGMGIAPADVPNLFDRFFQARRARQRKGGLGLGLYITKGIVEAHGGRLWLESIPEVGSTFHIWLPTLAESKPSHADSPGRLGKGRSGAQEVASMPSTRAPLKG